MKASIHRALLQAHLVFGQRLTMALVAALPALSCAQSPAEVSGRSSTAIDPVAVLVGRLDLESYKATIKSLTQFGDRREGTDRNRAAIDWIEVQLKKYGCTNTERMVYVYEPPAPPASPRPAAATPSAIIASGEMRAGVGGSRLRGVTRSAAPNNNPESQTDPALRALNAQAPTPGRREQVYCTKVGTTRPDEMYIIGAHMDGRGFGEAANDDGSGTALVMETRSDTQQPGCCDRPIDSLRALEQ